MTLHPMLPILLVLGACDYEAPVDDAIIGNGITGTVVFSGPDAPSTTFVMLYRGDDPGPPAGTGGPVTFTTVGADSFTGRDQGMEAGAFAFTDVPDGEYYVSALMDHDGDFNPFGAALAGATCGDAVGGHLGDLEALEPVAVQVRNGTLLEGVTVVLGRPLDTERPAFVPPEDYVVSRNKLASSIDAYGEPVLAKLQLLPLTAVGLKAAYSRDLILNLAGPCDTDVDCTALAACPCAADTGCATALPVWLVDDDGDGQVDPYPADLQASQGLLDVWPRVYIEYLGQQVDDPDTGGIAFESELGTFRHRGETLPERWRTEAFPMAAELRGAADQGIPIAFVAGGPIGVPFQAQALSVTLTPLFRHYHADGRDGLDASGPFDIVDLVDPDTPAKVVPAGTWSVTVIGPSGQAWTVPNELGLLDLPPILDSDRPATQVRGVVFK